MPLLRQASCHVVGGRGLAYTPFSVYYRYDSHKLFFSIIAYILSDSDIPDSVLSDFVLPDCDISDSDILDYVLSDYSLDLGKKLAYFLRYILAILLAQSSPTVRHVIS